eukprot:1161864-Pelagomonas_calceolata.AAC.21
MATRTSIRPRPVDINKQLTIVRDIGELDTTEGLPKEQGEAHHAGHGHASETATHAGVSGTWARIFGAPSLLSGRLAFKCTVNLVLLPHMACQKLSLINQTINNVFNVVQAADGHHAPHQKKPKPKEIPVPEVKKVPTYTREYLPTFKIPDTYIRGKGKALPAVGVLKNCVASIPQKLLSGRMQAHARGGILHASFPAIMVVQIQCNNSV